MQLSDRQLMQVIEIGSTPNLDLHVHKLLNITKLAPSPLQLVQFIADVQVVHPTGHAEHS